MTGMTLDRLLPIFVATVIALVTGAFVSSTWQDHQVTRRQAEADLAEVARLMEEHTRAALLVGEVEISRLRETLGNRLPKHVGGPADNALLARISNDLPFFDSVWVFDADGNIRASSDLSAGKLNVADRAYYNALRDGASSFISPLIWGKVRSGAFVVMARRVDTPDGRFAGGVLVSLKGSFFTDFYRDLNPAPGAVFAIYKDDGSLVMRSTLPPAQETFPKPHAILKAAEQAPSGVRVANSSMDGVERIYAYRRMEDLPLVVTAGLPITQVFAEWRERTLRNGLITAAGLLAFLAVAVKLDRAMRRETFLRARAETLLTEKEMLFQEIHHRVKNNLQIIASFLTMQAVHSRDPATTDAFEEALSRLQAMGLVHQILYEQNEANEVAMAAYLRVLAATIGQTFGAQERGIHIEVAPSDHRLAMDMAVPLALLANEALTNALKHAFPGNRPGSIRMELHQEAEGLAFTLADDGVGMPAETKRGLGMTILSALARQLGGSLAWSTGPGTRLTLTVPA